MFRYAADMSLIADVDRWMSHHRARNLTSHTWNEEAASRVLAAVPGFVEDCRALVRRLEAAHGGT